MGAGISPLYQGPCSSLVNTVNIGLAVVFRAILAARWCVSWMELGSRRRCYQMKATPPTKHEQIQWWASPNWAASRRSWLRHWGRCYRPPPPPPAPAPAHRPPPAALPLLTCPSSSSSISSSCPCVSTSTRRNVRRIYMMSQAQMNVNLLETSSLWSWLRGTEKWSWQGCVRCLPA